MGTRLRDPAGASSRNLAFTLFDKSVVDNENVQRTDRYNISVICWLSSGALSPQCQGRHRARANLWQHQPVQPRRPGRAPDGDLEHRLLARVLWERRDRELRGPDSILRGGKLVPTGADFLLSLVDLYTMGCPLSRDVL